VRFCATEIDLTRPNATAGPHATQPFLSASHRWRDIFQFLCFAIFADDAFAETQASKNYSIGAAISEYREK
jgi:hypothetical protein